MIERKLVVCVEKLQPDATPNWNYLREEFLEALERAWGAGRDYALKGRDFSK